MTTDEDQSLTPIQEICLRIGFHLLKADFIQRIISDSTAIFSKDELEWKMIRLDNEVKVLRDNKQVLAFEDGKFILRSAIQCEEPEFWSYLKELIND